MTIEITSLTAIKVQDRSIIEPWMLLERQGRIRMRYYEFRLLKQVQWILQKREKSSLSRAMANLAMIVHLWLGKERIVILGTEPFRYVAFLANRLKRRHTCIWHGSWPWDEELFEYGVWSGLLMRIWARFFPGTVCVCASAAARDALLAHGARAFHIPWSVDTKRFAPTEARPMNDPPRVLFVGELSQIKGVHLLIQVIRDLNGRGPRFTFAGRGPYQADIERMARDGIGVDYRGFVAGRDALAQLMREHDVLVLPSMRIKGIEEKFGMVLIEAMACGLPVVGSDCIGPRQIISHGVDGLLIPQNDVPALKSAILELAGDRARRQAMGANGRRKAVATYDVEVLATKWMEAIEAAVAGMPVSRPEIG